MAGTKISELRAEPDFDLEEFLNLSRESRIEGRTMDEFFARWKNWEGKLKACILENGKNSWLAVWLPEEVEREVDELYDELPAQGFLLNNLAAYMCVSAVSQLIPQVAEGGCAPAPARTPELSRALREAGVLDGDGGGERRYAIITSHPFKGGCEICATRQACPKFNGAGDFASIVLPGHERGVSE